MHDLVFVQNIIQARNHRGFKGFRRTLFASFLLVLSLNLNLMFLFWVAFSFLCDHARFRTPFKKSGYGPVIIMCG